MDIVELTPELYPLWNQFCAESKYAWFWHTAEWLAYTLDYRPDWKPQSLGFLVRQDNLVWAVCPLVLEERIAHGRLVREFSYSGGGCPGPALAPGLSEKMQRRVFEQIATEVDRLAAVHGVERILVRQSPLEPRFFHQTSGQLHPLQSHGYLDVSTATHVLDLEPAEEDLLKQMRKGHRCDVKRATKPLEARIYDRETITQRCFDGYRNMHARAAGRITRPESTFDRMYHWIQQGLAILAEVKVDERPAGYALISIYKDGAYYSSSCEEPGLGNLPLGHALQWAAIRWLKKNGVRHYEIGIQQNGQPHNLMSDKEAFIAHFKRGFGGRTLSYWCGERYYTRRYWLEIAQARAEAYSAYLPLETCTTTC